MKRLLTAIGMALALLFVITANAWAVEDNTETLTIKGDGVSQEITFPRADLESMTKGITQHTYSVTNNFPTDKVLYRRGVSLQYLLEQAGIKDTAKLLTFTSSDGYARSFTYQELLKDRRYYFGSNGSKTEVPAIIAFADSSKGFDSLSETDLVLTMGQRVRGEQNNPWFVKYLQTIEVRIDTPEQWPKVTFNKSVGPDGVTVKLNHPNFDAVKIYYTLDGTDPTLNSNMYNVSASYYQPHLNQPLVIKKNTEIRAIAIGAGKNDSAVASTTVNFDTGGFSDLGNYPWARTAIEELSSKGIISGMGDSRFAPGEPLTRAQFAAMIVLALEEKPLPVSTVSFRDVRTADWYYGFVEKAARMGLINGYPDKTFGPNKTLSRQEMLAIVIQAMGINTVAENVPPDLLAPFANETRISDWARVHVAFAESLGILEHGNIVLETARGLAFDGKGNATRAEAAVTVYRMLQSR